MKQGVAYYRVSTERQGDSGLGLEAQQEAVHLFARYKKIKLVQEFIEVESGKNNRRPILKRALSYCAGHNDILLIAKLDRLGRNVAFISALMESKVRFIAVDNPEANHLVLHIMAAFAEYEREQISQRTKDALQAAKRRGVKLGVNGKALAAHNRQMSESFSRACASAISTIKLEGFITIQAITNELNRRGVPTYRPGSRWHNSTVHALLKRQEELIKTKPKGEN
jgi:DNA invertase Pin-like site-specific DNA recombinase